MTTKNESEKNISEKEIMEKIELKRNSSKIIFVFTAFLFFLVFYMAGAGIGKGFSEKIIFPLYILLLVSLNLFIFFSTQKIFFEKKVISYIISGVFVALSIFFILPVIF